MRLERLSVMLRPRTAWEASDLGIALVRAHWRLIAQAWCAVTLPLLALFTLGGYLIGQVWLAALVLWWLKPWFDRIPLYVVSRAVFGNAPSLSETVGAGGALFGPGIWPWLLWRRLHPTRSLLLPIDLLEGQRGAARAARAKVLAHSVGSPGFLLTLIGWHLELMLGLSVLVLALMFVPVEFLSESARAMRETLFEDRPAWAQMVLVAIGWLAMTVIEPLYVGAGFGLYLNRRIQLEAWDIELAFRRLAERLRGLAAVLPLALLLSVMLTSLPVLAAAPEAEDAEDAAQNTAPLPLPQIFSRQYRDDSADWQAAVERAYQNTDLRPRRQISEWKLRHRIESDGKPKPPTWLKALAGLVALAGEYGLWLLFGGLLVALLVYHRAWLPWVSEALRPAPGVDSIGSNTPVVIATLPADLPGAVRARWGSDPRAAMALLYRAAVLRLVERLGTPLAPGSTEADCLRASRRLGGQPYAALFARIVQHWQATAYADMTLERAALEALLEAWVGDATKPVDAEGVTA